MRMQRITKRNEYGGIEIDGINLALERLAEYEDTGTPDDFINYKLFFLDTTALPNCNNCGDKDSCDRCPSAGESVRWNCPLWISETAFKEEEEPHEIEAHTLKEWDHIFGKDKRHGPARV